MEECMKMKDIKEKKKIKVGINERMYENERYKGKEENKGWD